MNPIHLCPSCQGPLPEGGTLDSLCPACLLSMAREPASMAGAAASPDLELLRVRFPELEILEVIGRGGSGVVYRARQTRLDRLVALKILDPELSKEDSFAGRFLREARTLARLDHPAIVGVHDFGERDGCFYLLMEYVDGVSLRERLEARDLDAQDVLEIIPRVCEGLQYAHEAGVVHRDIKPENLLLSQDGRVKIADFGLAKLMQLGGPALTRRTQVMGTPHYMAPEQVNRPLEVDHRADIYSLGVVLYEMLTTKLPIGRFALPSQLAHSSDSFDPVVSRALEQEPTARYQRVSEVRADLEGIGREASEASTGSASASAAGARQAACAPTASASPGAGASTRSGSPPEPVPLPRWIESLDVEPRVLAVASLVLAWGWLLLLHLIVAGRDPTLRGGFFLGSAFRQDRLSQYWLAAAYPLAFLALWVGRRLPAKQVGARWIPLVAFASSAAILARVSLGEPYAWIPIALEGMAALVLVGCHLVLDRWVRGAAWPSFASAALLMCLATVMHSALSHWPSREAFYHVSGISALLGLSSVLLIIPEVLGPAQSPSANRALLRSGLLTVIAAACFFNQEIF